MQTNNQRAPKIPLDQFPVDILANIARHLPPNSLVKFMLLTSKSLRAKFLSRENSSKSLAVIKEVFKRYFPHQFRRVELKPNIDWLKELTIAYKKACVGKSKGLVHVINLFKDADIENIIKEVLVADLISLETISERDKSLDWQNNNVVKLNWKEADIWYWLSKNPNPDLYDHLYENPYYYNPLSNTPKTDKLKRAIQCKQPLCEIQRLYELQIDKLLLDYEKDLPNFVKTAIIVNHVEAAEFFIAEYKKSHKHRNFTEATYEYFTAAIYAESFALVDVLQNEVQHLTADTKLLILKFATSVGSMDWLQKLFDLDFAKNITEQQQIEILIHAQDFLTIKFLTEKFAESIRKHFKSLINTCDYQSNLDAYDLEVFIKLYQEKFPEQFKDVIFANFVNKSLYYSPQRKSYTPNNFIVLLRLLLPSNPNLLTSLASVCPNFFNDAIARLTRENAKFLLTKMHSVATPQFRAAFMGSLGQGVLNFLFSNSYVDEFRFLVKLIVAKDKSILSKLLKDNQLYESILESDFRLDFTNIILQVASDILEDHLIESPVFVVKASKYPPVLLCLMDWLRQQNIGLLVILTNRIVEHTLQNKDLLKDVLLVMLDLPVAFRAINSDLAAKILFVMSDHSLLPTLFVAFDSDVMTSITKAQWSQFFDNTAKKLPTKKYIELIRVIDARCKDVLPQMFLHFEQNAIIFAKRRPEDLFDVLAAFATYKHQHQIDICSFFKSDFLSTLKEKYPKHYEYFLQNLLKDTTYFPVNLKKVEKWQTRICSEYDIVLLQSLLCEYLQFNLSFFNSGFKRHHREETREILQFVGKETSIDEVIDYLSFLLSKQTAHVINPLGDLRALLYVVKSATKPQLEHISHVQMLQKRV